MISSPSEAGERPHVLGPAVEIGEVVLEDLDAVIARPRRRRASLSASEPDMQTVAMALFMSAPPMALACRLPSGFLNETDDLHTRGRTDH